MRPSYSRAPALRDYLAKPRSILYTLAHAALSRLDLRPHPTSTLAVVLLVSANGRQGEEQELYREGHRCGKRGGNHAHV